MVPGIEHQSPHQPDTSRDTRRHNTAGLHPHQPPHYTPVKHPIISPIYPSPISSLSSSNHHPYYPTGYHSLRSVQKEFYPSPYGTYGVFYDSMSHIHSTGSHLFSSACSTGYSSHNAGKFTSTYRPGTSALPGVHGSTLTRLAAVSKGSAQTDMHTHNKSHYPR